MPGAMSTSQTTHDGVAGNRAGGTASPRPAVLLLLLLTSSTGAVARPTALVGDRFVDADAQRVIARWAFGLRDPADLPAYRAAGFNVVYIDLPAADAAGEQAARALAAAAAAAGLPVILALNAIDATEGAGNLELADPGCVRRTSAWLADAAAEWLATPGLLAYALQEDLEERLTWSWLGFAQYLRYRYGDLDALNQRWLADPPLRSFDEATGERVAAVDGLRPGGLGRASMDLARWRLDGVETLLKAWAGALAIVDPAHPVLGGRMDRFRTLLAAPTELAGLQPAMLERTGWSDPIWHQAGAVDVARQAGRFAAVPTLETRAEAASLGRWVRLALGRGAAGVALASWSEVRDHPDRLAAVRAAFAEAEARHLAEFTPTPGAAVVLQPLARGPELGPRRVYGYGEFGGDEPAGLLELIRRSTRHGPLAVLGARDLTRVPLNRYGCLFLPAVLDLSPLAIDALAEYCAAGGVLFADLGAGCYEPVGDPARLPDKLAEVFGVEIAAVRLMMDVALNQQQRDRLRTLAAGELAFPELGPDLSHPGSLVFKRYSALFPGLQPPLATPPAMADRLLRSPAAFCYAIAGDTRTVAEQTQLGGRGAVRPATAGLTVHPYGYGSAAFCGTFIYQAWRPDEPTFDLVHDGLLGQRPTITRATGGLCEDETYVARGGETLWIQRLAPTPTTLQLDLPSLEGQAYPGGLNVLRRPVPKDPASPVQAGTTPLVNRLITTLEPNELRVTEPLPVSLWPSRDTAGLAIGGYTRHRLELHVYGSSEHAQRQSGGRWAMAEPQPVEAVLIIADGEYPVPPGSRHLAEWWQPTTTESEAFGMGAGSVRHRNVLTAGPEGRIVVRDTFVSTHLTLVPERGQPAAPGAGGG